MSAIEYNNLLFKVSQRLNELNVGRQLLIMCRGKVAPRSEENLQDVFSLFVELEEKEFLGPDRLDVLKDVLEGLEEWPLLENVEKFEAKKREYDGLLEQIIQALDEINDLERLVSICKGKIPQERQSSIHDVRALFKELKNNNCLRINHLGILKTILTQTEKRDLLEKVKEFQERRTLENKFERRKAQAAAIVSSASGVLNIKTVFKVAAGGLVLTSAYQLLRRGCTYEQLLTAVNTCVLPAGAKLLQITEGSVYLKVQAESLTALDLLWRLYKNGTLKKRLQALFVTDEMRDLAGGEQVEVVVTIDEKEYEKARNELTTVEAQDEPDGHEGRRLQYLAQEKFSYITNYLEQTRDTDVHSVSTDDDSGKPGSSSAPSEFGFEETSDSTSKLCLKDLRKEVTKELTVRLNEEQDVLNRFYRSFGVDPDLLNYDLDYQPRNIRDIFPDTPVKLLKDVFEALQLFDFAEFLEKATKPQTLRPALSLKEIEKLWNVSNRPTKVYSKAEVLIIELCDGPQTAAGNDRNDAERVGSFFTALNSENEITLLTSKSSEKLFAELDNFVQVKEEQERAHRRVGKREELLKTLLENKIPESHMKEQVKELRMTRELEWRRKLMLEEHQEGKRWLEERLVPNTDERLLSVFYKEESAMRNELKELAEKTKKWENEIKPSIEKRIKEKEEELKNETETLEMGVSTVIDKWAAKLHANDQGKESTLFVAIIHNSLSLKRTSYALHQTTISIDRCLSKKLALIPETKLVITNNVSPMREKENISRETLEVDLSGQDVLSALLQLLEMEYNNLLYQISKRLDELDVGEQLLVMCRGKVAVRSGEDFQSFSLFEELEQKGFLSPDHLVLLKRMLKGVNEWPLFEEVEKFETKRKEYNNLLEQIIRVLDELNDLERLVSICRGKIAEERQGNVINVRSLFEELEENEWLGIDCLDTLKEILTLTEKSDLLKEVEEFEQRQSRENKFKKRKAQAASFVSSVSDKLSGVLNVKTVFKVVAGTFTVASSLSLLTRDCTYDQLVSAINTSVLPAGANLIQISEGCVCLKVQVTNLSALEDLWRLYKFGTLRASLQALFVTDEVRELAGREQVEVDVTIDEEEYEKARNELSTFREKVLSSDEPDGQEERQPQYLDQEKLSYITNYLEQTRDTDVHSVSTEDDSGKAASYSAPSEFGFEETSDSTSKLCLKDLSMELTEELTSKLNRNKDVLNRFYRSFGLDPDLLHDELNRRNIGTIFPDTPVKLLRDVFEALKLYDFAEFLEKATKPRTLRPALPLKEIEKLSSVSSRPTKVYSKAKVLIVDVCEACESSADSDVETAGSFFKAQNSQNEVTTLRTDSFKELLEDLDDLARRKSKEESDDSRAQTRETQLKYLLRNKIPDSWFKFKKRETLKRFVTYRIPGEFHLEQEVEKSTQLEAIGRFNTEKDEQLLTLFSKEEPGMRNELKQLKEKREQWETERKPLIEKQINEKEEELKKETDKFEMAILSVIDKWIDLHPNDKGKPSTLFIVLIQNSLRLERTGGAVLKQMIISIKRCLSEKLALIPETKVVVTSNVPGMGKGNISSETLKVYLSGKGVLTTLLQLLSKRLDTLDLISVMQELQRTAPQTDPRYYRRYHDVNYTQVQIRDNLSSVPRLQKME